MGQRVYLYGFEKLHRVVEYKFLRSEKASIGSMDKLAEYMLDHNQNIESIYAVVDWDGLKFEFLETVIKPHYTKDIEFEDLIERRAIRGWYRLD